MLDSIRRAWGRLRQRTGGELIPLLSIAGLFMLLFRGALFGGRFAVIGDPLKQFYPMRTVAWETIRNGSLPLWTPHVLSGYPMFSMGMLGLGYPATWGYLFLPGHWAEQLYVLAPYLLAPLFTYAFLRELGRSPLASCLGAVTFATGGFLFSPIGLTGVHANSALWMPLLLLGVSRARRLPLLGPLLLSTVAFTMSILAGSPQIFLYAGSLSLAWGGFLVLVPEAPVSRHRRWSPFLVATGSIVLSAGLTAFQMMETWTAVGLSVRRIYPASRFAEGSFAPLFAWQSLLQPLGNYWDSSTWVSPVTLLLALAAAIHAVRHPRRSAQPLFWFAAAAISWLLILGSHTPLFELYSRLPFVSRFRYPSRHTLEWSFAIGVLGAFGWDLIMGWLERRTSRRSAAAVAAALSLGALAVVIAFRWRDHLSAAGFDTIHDLNNARKGLHVPYLESKALFTAAILGTLLASSRVVPGRLRSALLAAVVALSCYVEPWLWMVRPVITPFSVPASYFSSRGETTRLIEERLRPGERTFSVVHPYAVPQGEVRTVDGVNWTALADFEDANGYESLILGRYAAAFRAVPLEEVDAEPFLYPSLTLLDGSSRLLDLLGVRYVTAWAPFSSTPVATIEKEGISFPSSDLAMDISADYPLRLPASGFGADTLALVTTMAFSGGVEQGTSVARLSVRSAGGAVIERELRAGIETSEWAWDRADVKASIRHQRAPLFDSAPQDGFESHRFLARIPLGGLVPVVGIEFVRSHPEARIGLWKAVLYDSTSGTSRPLPWPSPGRWRTHYEKDGVVLLENLNALPRAWLVTSAEAADDEEIRRRVGGQSAKPWDPRRTALVEIDPARIPPLSGRALPEGSYARISDRQAARLSIETSSSESTMLVLGEIHFPGWVATLDGRETAIHQTDYLLRGVFLPPGQHRVEMRYRPPGLRKGVAISLGTLALIAVAAWFTRRAGSTAP